MEGHRCGSLMVWPPQWETTALTGHHPQVQAWPPVPLKDKGQHLLIAGHHLLLNAHTRRLLYLLAVTSALANKQALVSKATPEPFIPSSPAHPASRRSTFTSHRSALIKHRSALPSQLLLLLLLTSVPSLVTGQLTRPLLHSLTLTRRLSQLYAERSQARVCGYLLLLPPSVIRTTFIDDSGHDHRHHHCHHHIFHHHY